WYKADGNTNDSVGGNNGTLVGGATFGPGATAQASDQAFNFNANGYVSVPDSPSLQLTGDLTLDFWINPSATQNPFVDRLRKEDNSFANGFVIEMDGCTIPTITSLAVNPPVRTNAGAPIRST